MAKTKKSNLRVVRNDEDITFNIPYNREEPQNTLTYFGGHKFDHCEFVFQFDDDEPFVFATGPNECHITLNTTRDGHMTFTNNGRTFKLFARERENESHI